MSLAETLSWPFLEEHHRRFAEELARWADATLPDLPHDDVDAACRARVAALGKAGFLKACVPGCEAIMILLGDQPAIGSQLVGEMIRIYETSNASIVVPTYRGKRGHPIMFSSTYCDEVQKKFDGVGLRGLLSAHPEQVHEMKVEDESVLADMDVPGDYERERARQKR